MIESFKRRFATEGIELTFQEKTLRALAKSVQQSKIGVRGIDGQLAISLNHLLYDTLAQENIIESIEIRPEDLKLIEG